MHTVSMLISKKLKIHQNTEIQKVHFENEKWTLSDDKNNKFRGKYFICTTPLPQTLALLQGHWSLFDEKTLEELKSSTYHKCLSIMIALKGKTCLNFPGALQKPDQNWDFIADNYLRGTCSKHCLTAQAS